MEFTIEAIKQMKSDIKVLSLEQKVYRPQRKTVHFKGDRTMPAWKAVAGHAANRFELRYMYLAYGVMRGKSVDQTEANRKTGWSPYTLQKLLEKYEAVRISA